MTDTIEFLDHVYTEIIESGTPGPKGDSGSSNIADGSITIPKLSFDPATQVELDAHTTATTTAHGGIVSSTDPRLSDARTPTGAAGGVLAGNYPNPGFASDMATQVELDAHGHTTVPRTTVTTAAYTAVLADAGKVVRTAFAGASTLTIPANATVAFPLDTVINPYAAGGALTIAAATDVTIRNNGAAVAQFGEVSLRKDGTDEWVRTG